MAQKLEQRQTAVQTQQLATLQVAVAKLVELPVTELAVRVKDELIDNAALEVKEDNDEADFDRDNAPEEESGDEYEDEERESVYEGKEADAMSDYSTIDDVPDYIRQRADEEEGGREMQYSAQASFYEELERQIGERDFSEHERAVMEYLVGSLDEDGFLRKDFITLVDELAIYHNIVTDEQELERLLRVLQEFDPKGIGARSLQECLHIQLRDTEHPTEYTQIALRVVDNCFDDFTHRRWDNVKQRLKIDDDTFDKVKNCLTHLNPRPGRALSESETASAPTVVPDFTVVVSGDEVNVLLNRGEVPELQVSEAFKQSIKQYGGNKAHLTREQQDAYTYARQKVDAAQSFINLLSRRKQTLLSVMRAIVEKQKPFFLNDDDESLLEPLALKDIAEMAKVDISTVSRVTSSKFVRTLYGTYPLRFFFSRQFTTSEGDELSSRKVKEALTALLANENKKKPLSDEDLAEHLKAQGFNVARRTVAKYRDQMGVPTSRLRRE